MSKMKKLKIVLKKRVQICVSEHNALKNIF